MENELKNRKNKKNKSISSSQQQNHDDPPNKKTEKHLQDNVEGKRNSKGDDLIKTVEKCVRDELENVADDQTSILEKWIFSTENTFKTNFQINIASLCLFLIALAMRFYRLTEPRFIVFDELHYGKYISLYMKRTFFFDTQPPLGKQLIAAVGYLAGFDGNFNFDRIGSPYDPSVPIFALRFVPAFCGSLIVPLVYNIMLEIGLRESTAILASVLIVCDNAILTQSRFILIDSILITFSLFGLLCILKFRKCFAKPFSFQWIFWLVLGFASFTCALCVKLSGFYALLLGFAIVGRDFWRLLGENAKKVTDRFLLGLFLGIFFIVGFVIISVYVSVFYVHLSVLTKAGPHDNVMTSAFQASLEGGLASITKGQPLVISHGSQITLRHTHGRACWLHSHSHVYPIRYSDKRGSSHQQQVTCYSFKDVNNWWIVKRPDKNNLVVDNSIDAIKHGDIIQLVHGITSRALNSHDVAAPVTPQCQEVSCYMDYNVSMPAQNLWRVDIINREQIGDDTWHTIQSHVRLVHVNSSQALRYTGRQLPDWGFNQHEIVTDRIVNQQDTIWNVEEHRYTKTDDQKELKSQMVNAEMIPTTSSQLSFWTKFEELQRKMLFSTSSSNSDQSHMYSSEPSEWPFMTRGIAFWVSNDSNAQIHLLGNIVLWYSATLGIFFYASLLVFYLLRRHRKCYDLPEPIWNQFCLNAEIFFTGYLLHYVPHFFNEQISFIHHYLPAFIFKVLLFAALVNHLNDVFALHKSHFRFVRHIFDLLVLAWTLIVIYVFVKFIVFSYGIRHLTTNDIFNLRWKDTWDFIIHRQ